MRTTLLLLAVISFLLVAAAPAIAISHFFNSNLIPPPEGMQVNTNSPFVAFPNGIMIRNWCEKYPDNSVLPPAGLYNVEYNSIVDMEISFDGGGTWSPVTAPAECFWFLYTGFLPEWQRTQALVAQMNISGGTLPPGVMLREQAAGGDSKGDFYIQSISGGYMIDNFFDIYFEISIDGGASWITATAPGRTDLVPNPGSIEPIAVASDLLPSPACVYAASGYWQTYPNGIAVKDVEMKFFSLSEMPPAAGAPSTHSYDFTVDMQFSLDSGVTWQTCRAAGWAESLRTRLHEFNDTVMVEDELTYFTVSGGDLPAGVMIRESPTLANGGMTSITGSGGGAGGGYMVSSFFDIFTEISTDGGMTWLPASGGAGRLQIVQVGAEEQFSSSSMPPITGMYYSPDPTFVEFANGIIIRNFNEMEFLQTFPLPELYGFSVNEYDSTVHLDISFDGGLTYAPVSASAHSRFSMERVQDSGAAIHINHNMLQKTIAGGDLPPAVIIREVPSKISYGRTSLRNDSGSYYIDSFFDIFLEVSTDGGMTWSPTVDNAPGRIVLGTYYAPPLVVVCPQDIYVDAESLAGAVVTYMVDTTGGYPPRTLDCVPPSGSIFPCGTTTVFCQAIDAIGQVTTCSFNITVRPKAQSLFYREAAIPPEDGMYIMPTQPPAYYPDGSYVSKMVIRGTENIPLPPEGMPAWVDSFFDIFIEVNIGGMMPVSGTVTSPVSLWIQNMGTVGDETTYSIDMYNLNLAGGGLPPGVMLRQNGGMPNMVQMKVRPVPGGYMIDSFFDIFFEISTDGGMSWLLTTEPVVVVLALDPLSVYSVPAPSDLLPPPVDQYTMYSLTFPSGVRIQYARHKLFTQATTPPQLGGTMTITYDEQVDMQIDLGMGMQPLRAPAIATMRMAHYYDVGDTAYFETEMLQLDLAGGELPPGVMLRESPTEVSQGSMSIKYDTDGSKVTSFFDIWLEVSLDGGQTWEPAVEGPASLKLHSLAPADSFPTDNLQPAASEYIHSNGGVPVAFPSGVLMHNIHQYNFTPSYPPPPPAVSDAHSCGLLVDTLMSLDGGSSWVPVTAQAIMTFSVGSLHDYGMVRYFDTEILQLDIAGGSLPPGVMLRESPTRASLGRLSQKPDGGGYQIDSFFDIYLELSLDGGMTWQPSMLAPSTMWLRPTPCKHCHDYADLSNLAALAHEWLWVEHLNIIHNIADLNCDRTVDFRDFAILAECWRGPCP